MMPELTSKKLNDDAPVSGSPVGLEALYDPATYWLPHSRFDTFTLRWKNEGCTPAESLLCSPSSTWYATGVETWKVPIIASPALSLYKIIPAPQYPLLGSFFPKRISYDASSVR